MKRTRAVVRDSSISNPSLSHHDDTKSVGRDHSLQPNEQQLKYRNAYHRSEDRKVAAHPSISAEGDNEPLRRDRRF